MSKNKPNEIYITRIYNAPVELVWDAWTDPQQVAKWWGPRGFSITTHSKELKPGGHWSYTMHGPDGTDYVNKTLYHEVETHCRLVYDHGGNEDVQRAPLFRVTVQFAQINKNTTQMEMTMALSDAKAAQETKKFIKQANGNSTWDRLAEYLEKQITGKELFVINRTFQAPLSLIYKMWTDPKHFSQWLAPTGFSMNFVRCEIKSGGSTFYCMSNNDQSVKMYGRAQYQEVSGQLLRYTQQFTDENENVARHPMAPTWPETMLTTVVLEPEEAEQTRITVTWEVVGNFNPEELKTFIEGRAGMTQGWTGSFDKLEEYLKTQV